MLPHQKIRINFKIIRCFGHSIRWFACAPATEKPNCCSNITGWWDRWALMKQINIHDIRKIPPNLHQSFPGRHPQCPNRILLKIKRHHTYQILLAKMAIVSISISATICNLIKLIPIILITFLWNTSIIKNISFHYFPLFVFQDILESVFKEALNNSSD